MRYNKGFVKAYMGYLHIDGKYKLVFLPSYRPDRNQLTLFYVDRDHPFWFQFKRLELGLEYRFDHFMEVMELGFASALTHQAEEVRRMAETIYKLCEEYESR